MNIKRQSADANSEMNPMLKLSDKSFKELIIKMPHQTIKNPLETKQRKISAKK